MRGSIFTNVCFAQSDENSLGMVKRFALEYEEDFRPFAEAIIAIDGVKNIKKAEGPWKRSWKERRQLKKENAKIQQEKEQRQKEYQIQRQKDLDEFNNLMKENIQKLEEKFGPGKELGKVSWLNFDTSYSTIKSCEVQFYFVLTDPLLGGFLEYKKENKSCNSIEEALDFFTTYINANLIFLAPPLPHVRNISINVCHREKDGKRAIELMAACGKPTFQIGYYTLLVTEN